MVSDVLSMLCNSNNVLQQCFATMLYNNVSVIRNHVIVSGYVLIAGGWHHILADDIGTSLMDGTESLINGRNRFTHGCDCLRYHEV